MYSIVIVDDRATNRAIYSQLVGSLGQDISVNAFGDAAGALDWLAANNADLIVTDYEMPAIDGDEFITRFRALPGASRVPIMMITVCGQREKKLRALESGATDFLRAPVDHYEFIACARNLLKLSQSAGGAVVAAKERNPAEDETRVLLERCGERGYALHVLEIDPIGPAPDLSGTLRETLRDSDFVARLDPLRYAVLQNEVAAPADARALARRLSGLRGLFAGVAALRAGAALPRPGEGAAACLLAAIQALRESEPGAASEGGRWRLAPAVDLATGALAGAQLLAGADEAALDDPEAWRVALACAARIGRAAGEFRVALRLGLGGDSAEAAILRLPAVVAHSGAGLEWLDLLIPIRDLGADGAWTPKLVHSLKALGARLIVTSAPCGETTPKRLIGRRCWRAGRGLERRLALFERRRFRRGQGARAESADRTRTGQGALASRGRRAIAGAVAGAAARGRRLGAGGLFRRVLRLAGSWRAARGARGRRQFRNQGAPRMSVLARTVHAAVHRARRGLAPRRISASRASP